MKLTENKTARGFKYCEFIDCYDNKCSLQESSLATNCAIWLGVDDPEPRIMCSDARKLGMETESDIGWMAYPLPKEVLISTRMHLTRDQVKTLLPILQKFVETGEI